MLWRDKKMLKAIINWIRKLIGRLSQGKEKKKEKDL